MATLKLQNVPESMQADVPLEVPTFGVDDEGNPYTVMLRGLTAYEWDLLIRRAWEIDGEMLREGGSDDNGSGPPLKLRGDYNEACLVTAWCSYDDEGDLVFGVDPEDAEWRVRRLRLKHRPDIRRIHRRVLELSKVAGGEKAAIEEAEKN